MAQENNQNLKGALAYLLGPITGIFFLLTEKENSFIRFHAAQSTLVFGALFILNFVPILAFFILPFAIVLWIFLMYKAYIGDKYKLPYVGNFVEQQLTK